MCTFNNDNTPRRVVSPAIPTCTREEALQRPNVFVESLGDGGWAWIQFFPPGVRPASAIATEPMDWPDYERLCADHPDYIENARRLLARRVNNT